MYPGFRKIRSTLGHALWPASLAVGVGEADALERFRLSRPAGPFFLFLAHEHKPEGRRYFLPAASRMRRDK